MVGEWASIPGTGTLLSPADDSCEWPMERTEIICLPNGNGVKVTLRVEKVAMHWRVVDHTFNGRATGPALEGLEWFPTCEAACEAGTEWLAAWRVKLLLGVPA